MSRKKGLSLEEKRTRLMELFFEKKDFFQLKELEKMGQKEKGITSMTVKDVLQSLVDDSMVDSERIGTSNYFWAFPSKALHARKRKLSDLTQQIEGLKKRKANNDALLVKARRGKDQTENRAQVLKDLALAKAEEAKLKAEVEKYKDLDPEVLKEKENGTSVAKEAANRWTDNVFGIKSWCKKKFGIEGKDIDKNYGVPADFDYLE
ncbi:meiotic nuclear division protein 1 homolog [Oscarella lobularis]|uniref:meiotic nuclear division protein 1 homolog n=1 Tax=Oscarella lobularis TaxID=121494 RepID=UPI0033136599